MIYPGTEQDHFVLDIEKGRIVPIFIEAVFLLPDGKEFRSKAAGFLYPFDCSGETAETFHWNRGPVCTLLFEIEPYLSLEKINVARLISLIGEKSEEESFWSLDYQNIFEELVSGEFSYYDVQQKRKRTVILQLESGVWMNADITGEDLTVLDSEVFEIDLFRGFSSYLHSSGLIAEVQVESDGSSDFIVY